MTSAPHAEGRQLDPGQVLFLVDQLLKQHISIFVGGASEKAQCEVGQNPPLYLIGTAAGGLGMPVAKLGVHCPGPSAAVSQARWVTPGQDRTGDLQRVGLTS